jgi:hypothetical protein
MITTKSMLCANFLCLENNSCRLHRSKEGAAADGEAAIIYRQSKSRSGAAVISRTTE